MSTINRSKLIYHNLGMLILLMLISSISFGQKRQGKIVGEVFGQIFDEQSGNPMEYATVSLKSLETDALITGTISDEFGKFDILDVPMGKFKLIVSFIGYEDKEIAPIIVSRKNRIQQFKEIKLKGSLLLEEVVIEGSTPNISYQIDKKIVDVSKMNTNLGQSAVEILENVPSIKMDIDGVISLRGSSSFTLLIDGKPTVGDASDVMNTIPASTIKSIEIITNPSAKYDAEGVSGIINIVLKQNKLRGVSLLSNVSGGIYGAYNGDVAVSYREKKVGLNISASHRNRPRLGTREVTRTRTVDDQLSLIESEEKSNGAFNNSKINGEFVYEPNRYHSLIIGGGHTWFNMNSDNDIFYKTSLDGIETDKYKNHELAIRPFRSLKGNMAYQYHIGQEKDHYVEFKAAYSSWSGSEMLDSEYFGDNNVQYGGTRRTEEGPSGVWRYNLNYSKKKGKSLFETGVQMQFGESHDDSRSYEYNPTSKTYDIQDIFSKDVIYNRDVAAAYALYGNKYKGLGYQIGLRAEHTFRNITVNAVQDYRSIDRLDWFPSVHLSYALPNQQEILVNYSKRINRPRSYFFEPFITWESEFSVSRGNPDLLPEYIDAFELNWIKQLSKGNVGIELYYRDIKNLINRTTTVYEDDVLLRSPVNIGSAQSMGAQFSLSHKLKKWWNSDISLNLYRYKLKGQLNEFSYNSESFNWDTRWSNTFPLRNNWRLQLVGNYEGPTTTIQGESEGNFAANVSIKKSFMNNKFSFTLQGRDILSTKRRESTIITSSTKVHMLRIPRSPVIMLTCSLRLNNYKYLSKSDSVEDI